MKVKLIIISIILLLVMVFASGCIPFMEKLGLVSPTNEEQLTPEKTSSDGLVKVLIGFKEKPGAAQQAMVRGVGGKIKYTYHIVDAIAASIPEKAIVALQNNPNVTHVELDGEIFAIDQALPWGVGRIGAEVVHTSGNKGAGVNVAILDTGIDSNHPDLLVVGGENFSPGKKSYDDENGHGSHVAGIVAALDNEIGVIGVAPEVNLFAVKVLGDRGIGRWSDLIAGLQWCVDYSMQVANMSLGATLAPSDVKAACDSAYAVGVLLVAAAGNENGGSVIYPAAYDSVIAVSATDSNDELAFLSSVGDEVELAAPGVYIYSTYKDGGYAILSGTSMASPHVAGVAALAIAAEIADVRTQLQDTADSLGDSKKYGYGLVNAAEAAGVGNEPPTVSITSPADSSTFDSEASILFEGTATDSEDGDLTAELDWTSNIDGQIDTGGSFSTSLSDGTHTITAEVTDSGGKTGSDSISITVGTLSMHVSDIHMSLKKAGINVNAIATVTIVDDNTEPNPVEGATVFGTWSGATDDSDSGVTDVNGKVSLLSDKVKIPKGETATFTFTVDDVIKDGYPSLNDVGDSVSIAFPE